ncbi:energy transducer TonB [Brevundimonas sp. NPDC090276]|uniref:energy transducer TonB n=1 Tax=Brevundimonas sp. NPDC090276 TaxID=3363956 RepID=UPI00383A9713
MPSITALLMTFAVSGVDPEMANATWLNAPVARPTDYPRFASIVRAEGHVVVQCESLPTGALSACTAMSEKPAGLGFGDEAVRVVERGRTVPRTVDGTPAASRIQTRIPFRISSEPPPKPGPWIGPEPTAGQRESARRWAIQAASRMPRFARFGLEELPADRRAVVTEWITELYPDRQKAQEIFTVAAARLLAEIGLAEMPPTRPLDEGTWNRRFAAASADQFDGAAADAELRRRYCARYECAPSR